VGRHFPSWNGEPRKIVDYMRSQNQVPIMTNPESVLLLSPNAYDKPATALNILRETILGRELFDFAFKQYALALEIQASDTGRFFRTMEDASGTDLDWFWRGWFYTTDAVDISIDGISEYGVSTKDPRLKRRGRRRKRQPSPSRSRTSATRRCRRRRPGPRAEGFLQPARRFHGYQQGPQRLCGRAGWAGAVGAGDAGAARPRQASVPGRFFESRRPGDAADPGNRTEKRQENHRARAGRSVALLTEKISKVLITDEPMVGLVQDPYWETADIDTSNNAWPRKITPSRLELFKQERDKNNLMKDFNTPLKAPDAPQAKAEEK
jgi:hypothetical protein